MKTAREVGRLGSSAAAALHKVAAIGAGLCVFAMALVIGYAVLKRFLQLPLPSVAADEYGGFLLAAATWLAVGSSVTGDRFPRAMALVNIFPAKVKRTLELAANVAAILVLLLLTWQSWKFVSLSFASQARSDIGEVLFFIPQSFIPLGTLIGAIAIGRSMLRAGDRKTPENRPLVD